MMDVIDCLPPGLHEMVITPRPERHRAGWLRHRRLDLPFRATIHRRRHQAGPQQPGRRSCLCRRGQGIGT
jgi:hypothetical protein